MLFTFQYGQIYYLLYNRYFRVNFFIYIPIWLDLLFSYRHIDSQNFKIYIPIWLDLLSIHKLLAPILAKIYIPIWLDLLCVYIGNYIYGRAIYIPIWLDLLSTNYKGTLTQLKDLHSNMVRFIIYINPASAVNICSFTFQYGQIYYCFI